MLNKTIINHHKYQHEIALITGFLSMSNADKITITDRLYMKLLYHIWNYLRCDHLYENCVINEEDQSNN